MKNEEKALEIARLKSISEFDKYENPFKREIYDRCMEMAEWKDKQLIGKACKWLKKNWVKYPNPDVRTEQLVADFRRAMEEEIC